MALRDKLRDRMQPFLEPGEQIHSVVMAQTGPSPWFALLTWLVVLFGAKFYVIAFTDRGIVAAKASWIFPSKPKELALRLPRNVRVGEVSGVWGKTQILGENTHVHKRFHKDLRAADEALAATGATAPAQPDTSVTAGPAPQPAGWYPDPSGSGQRYWDGAAWTDQTHD